MTATFVDRSGTGLRWEMIPDGAPYPRGSTGTMLFGDAARLAARLHRQGWAVDVRGYGPGASAIRAAVGVH